jgi:predicted dehydrogenase
MRSHRRRFLQSSAATLPLLAATESARGFLANDTVRIGLIGTGGRCRHLMGSFPKLPGVQVTALCDVWDRRVDEARSAPGAGSGPFFTTRDHRALLDRKDVDAVLIATPDHQHVPITIDAVAAGKHVYVEKPLTHDLSEGPKVIAAVRNSKSIVQVGQQQRSMPHIQKAAELVKAGALGPVFKVALSWNRNTNSRFVRSAPSIPSAEIDWKRFLGPAPDQPHDPWRQLNWRWCWDFGGGILTDLMVHWIDVAHWILGLDHPSFAATIGQYFAATEVWDTPDTIECLLQYKGPVTAHFEGTFSNQRNAAMITFMGPEATLYIDRGAFILTPEPASKSQPQELILGSDKRRGADFYDQPDGETVHLADWLAALRAGKDPSCPIEAGVSAAAAAHLGNIAYRGSTVAAWPQPAPAPLPPAPTAAHRARNEN